VEWANDYRHYLSLRRNLEKKLEDVAWGDDKHLPTDVINSERPDIARVVQEAMWNSICAKEPYQIGGMIWRW